MTNFNRILHQRLQLFTPILSADGYIRLTLKQLEHLKLLHLHSDLYTEQIINEPRETSLTDIEGYTEWVSNTKPNISVSWDWQVDHQRGAKIYSMAGKPFSNILLQNNQRRDLGLEESITILGQWLNTIDWQEEILHYIKSKYS